MCCNLQVQTAYKCALVLRDLIAPYLLRRLKKDVAKQLPKKTEKVLFCRLSETQLSLYREYVNSRECTQVMMLLPSHSSRNERGIDIQSKHALEPMECFYN